MSIITKTLVIAKTSVITKTSIILIATALLVSCTPQSGNSSNDKSSTSASISSAITSSTAVSSASVSASLNSSTVSASKSATTSNNSSNSSSTKSSKSSNSIIVDEESSAAEVSTGDTFTGKTINPSANIVLESIIDDANIWRKTNRGVSVTKNTDKAYVKEGNSSIKMTFSEFEWSGAMWEPSKVRLNLVPEASYKISFNLYWPQNYVVGLWWQFYYIAGGLRNVQEYSSKPAGAATGWFKYEKIFVAEQDENYLPIFMIDRVAGGPFTFYLDSLKIEEVFS